MGALEDLCRGLTCVHGSGRMPVCEGVCRRVCFGDSGAESAGVRFEVDKDGGREGLTRTPLLRAGSGSEHALSGPACFVARYRASCSARNASCFADLIEPVNDAGGGLTSTVAALQPPTMKCTLGWCSGRICGIEASRGGAAGGWLIPWIQRSTCRRVRLHGLVTQV